MSYIIHEQNSKDLRFSYLARAINNKEYQRAIQFDEEFSEHFSARSFRLFLIQFKKFIATWNFVQFFSPVPNIFQLKIGLPSGWRLFIVVRDLCSLDSKNNKFNFLFSPSFVFGDFVEGSLDHIGRWQKFIKRTKSIKKYFHVLNSKQSHHVWFVILTWEFHLRKHWYFECWCVFCKLRISTFLSYIRATLHETKFLNHFCYFLHQFDSIFLRDLSPFYSNRITRKKWLKFIICHGKWKIGKMLIFW